MPSALPTLSRRRLLVGALPATLALGVLGAGVGCAPEAPPADLAELQSQLDRARSDTTLAGDAAAALGRNRPAVVAALTAVAAERTAHGDALAAEITRLTDGEAPTTSATPTTTTTGPGTAAAAPTVEAVIDSLRGSAEQATEAAGTLSGYRAGLLGSIAASCTAAYQVALGGQERS